MKSVKILLAGAILASGLMVSCKESNDKLDKNLAYKIENKEALTDVDYTRMIEYVGEYAVKAQKYEDDLINGVNQIEAQEGLDKLNAEFPYLVTFRNCIKTTPVEKFSSDNKELLVKYQNYIEFSLPLDMTYQTLPGEAGIIVDDTNGVVVPVE